MKLIYLLIILSYFLIYINSLEIRVSEYRNPKCEGDPIISTSYSKCSPGKYWRVTNNQTIISGASVKSIDQCRFTKYSTLKFQNYTVGECKLEENFGYSFKYELHLQHDPKTFSNENYCNQVNYFDCNNYNIYSFQNNTCELISSTNFTKRACIGDRILNYHCKTEKCLVNDQNTDCILVSSEEIKLGKEIACESFMQSQGNNEMQIGNDLYKKANNSYKLFINIYILVFLISVLLLLLLF